MYSIPNGNDKFLALLKQDDRTRRNMFYEMHIASHKIDLIAQGRTDKMKRQTIWTHVAEKSTHLNDWEKKVEARCVRFDSQLLPLSKKNETEKRHNFS